MTEEYKKFVKDHNIRSLTSMESELLQFLVKNKLGGFLKIVNLYRSCMK